MNLAKINADIYTDSFTNAAITISKLHSGDIDTSAIMKKFEAEAEKLSSNDLSEIEYALLMHAKTLDHFFYETLPKLTNIGMIKQLQVFAELALRAQNQARKAYIALAELKHPKRAMFIKQQNNVLNQQINNNLEPRSGKIKKVANELLEESHEQWLDRETQATPITTNPPMETVEISRIKNRKRQKYQ